MWSARRVVTTAVGRVTRLAGLVVGAALAAVSGALVMTQFDYHGYEALFVIAVGMFALAWMERSWGCGVVAVLFAAATLLPNLYDVENIYYDLFGYTPAEVVVPLSDLLLPGLVLVIGGVVGWAETRRSHGRA